MARNETKITIPKEPVEWDERLNAPGSKWQHESRLGTYDCTIDENAVITLTHRASGKVQTAQGYDELKQVDLEPATD